jgi:hypothetical protein
MRKRNPLWLDLVLAVGAGVAGTYIYQTYVAPALAATPAAPGAAPLPAVPAGTPPTPTGSTVANPPATPTAVPGGISVPADGNSAHVPVGGTLIITAPASGGTLTAFTPVIPNTGGVPIAAPSSLPITNGTATLTNLPAGTAVFMATWTNTAGAQTQQQFIVISP